MAEGAVVDEWAPFVHRARSTALSPGGRAASSAISRLSQDVRVRHLLSVLDRLGGFASRRELEVNGVISGWIDVAADYRVIERVRQGWYTKPGEHPEVVRAWRAGGRLTCVSATAFHAGLTGPTLLHVEVAAGAAKLRNPDRARMRLSPGAPVVVHWTRHPGPGDRRAVAADHAAAIAGRCYAAVSSASASRIV